VVHPAAVRPLSGSATAIERILAEWLVAADPPALAIRTSGSTGEPKEVLLSRPAVIASATGAMSRLGGPGQWLLALPAHYVAGMQVIVRSLLAKTPPVLLADHPDLTAAASVMSSGRRYLSLVPTQLHRLLPDPTQAEALARFDAVLVGGSAVRQNLLDEARSHGVRVVTTYGMSETCGGCVYDGFPLDGVDVTIGSGGRIWIAGSVLFDGYAGRPDLTETVLRDGWLRTPDLGSVDPDGRLTVVGRADDVVVSGGVNVPVTAVEQRLQEHPAVTAVAVVGVPDGEWGERVVAVVVPREGSEVQLAELRDFVAERHAREWAPRELLLTSTLPLLESGKLDRLAIREALSGATHG
jgi:O-succinylbenzoic acid--CoA ligase